VTFLIRNFLMLLTGTIAVIGSAPLVALGDKGADCAAMAKTVTVITQGFAEGDVDAVMRYHHADVAKALNYKKVVAGRAAVKAENPGSFATRLW
jgi:hypothetical protein